MAPIWIWYGLRTSDPRYEDMTTDRVSRQFFMETKLKLTTLAIQITLLTTQKQYLPSKFNIFAQICSLFQFR